MTKATVIAVVIIMILSADKTKAGVSVVQNGSFEDDGIIADITVEIPQRWDDVNMPSIWFGGAVYGDWATHGDYYLIFYTYPWGTFAADEMAIISQQVYLADVNQIIFDLKLDTDGDPWDPAKRSAVMLIDGEVVWESNSVGSDVRGDYFDQTVDVNETYKSAGLHTLTLAIRANVSETSYIEYRTQWDFVRFDTHCQGFGYLAGDINLDCYVDWFDLKMLTGQWLVESPVEKYDLFQDADNIVNFNDFAVLAENWTANSFELDSNLLAMDFNYDGIVNFYDFAMLAQDWRTGGADYNDIALLADEWLQ